MDTAPLGEATCLIRRTPDAGPTATHPPAPLAPEDVEKLLPAVGSRFLGFDLVAELGRGASGRVYLARQSELADRLVALKVTTGDFDEPHALAQCQHTNVVPIHSAHRVGPLCAVCMPYFGATTLADVIRELAGRGSLPTTGKALIDALDRRHDAARPPGPADDSTRPGRGRPSVAHSPPAASPLPPTHSVGTPPAPRAAGILRMLQKIAFVDACLWVASRLADGLAHAHDRGILHLDLKPANVLLTDEGQPMLLDFNMARDTKAWAADDAAVGGTLPYMAPEHLAAFAGGFAAVDARADVYSLGVILFELLARRRPFPPAAGRDDDPAALAAARRAGPPPLRCWNRAVTPAVEAIVRKCLDPDPARRYQSAQDLAEDLQQQLTHRPLRHAAEPSVRERVRKWACRHPRLASWTTAAALAVAVTAALAGTLAARGRQLARLEAQAALAQFEDDARDVQFLLIAGAGDHDQLDRGLAGGRALLARYGVFGGPRWEDRPAVRELPDADRDRLRQTIGDTLLLVAQGLAFRADGPPAAEAAQQALALNQRAEALYPAGQAPRAVWLQRGRLLAAVGDDDGAARAAGTAAATPLRTARDHYLVAAEHAAAGRPREALPHLDTACRLDPQDFWAAFLQAVCCDELARDAEALAAYRACLALRPDFPRAWLNRGLVELRRHDDAAAKADFDRALELDPADAAARAARAVALARLGERAAAQADAREAVRRDPRAGGGLGAEFAAIVAGR